MSSPQSCFDSAHFLCTIAPRDTQEVAPSQQHCAELSRLSAMGVSLGYIPSKMWQLIGSRKSSESKSKWLVFSTLRDKLPRDEPSGAT